MNAADRGKRAGEKWAASKRVRDAQSVSLLHMAQASGAAFLREVEAKRCATSDVIDYCQAFQNAAAAALDARGQARP